MSKILLLIAAVLTLSSCSCTGSKTKKATKTQMIAGGYSQQREPNAEELALFKQVTAELDGVKYTPETVATQVVAGRNYRFVCKAVTATREPKTYKAEVVVYQPLPGQGEPRISKITKL